MPFDDVLAGRTIVVVDDHAGMLDLLDDTLASAGARVLRAANALDALALVVDHDVDAVVSDLRMPAMSGLDLARALRGLRAERKRSIVAVAVSGDDSWRYIDPNKAASAGFDYHLEKPVEPSVLVATVRELIERRARSVSGTMPRIDAAPGSGVDAAPTPTARRKR
ncbi:MAG: response regulator [Myxococcota bacterium]|nr:response regulator [Myxococcota bacterium]